MKKNEKLAAVRQFYPNAISTDDGVSRLISYIKEQLSMQPEQVMLADSICSDDVNAIQYPERAREFLGPFKLGGLDGYPFVGPTGMGAYAHHVPDNGVILIYYGPHIGVSKEGVLGKIHRHGQKDNSGCCGAALGALGALQKGDIKKEKPSRSDFQMDTIKQIFLKSDKRILDVDEKMQIHEATEVMYEAIDKRIRKLVQKQIIEGDIHFKHVILVGGIHINGDKDMGSFTSVKRFDLYSKDAPSSEWTNLLGTCVAV
ncbi:hypothetical protein IC229_27110 [Spirosoma sp. BT702]|uniref:Limiting CO2-inducible protein B/C beta carbonyic anhydrase domain-containing protein n=1 Tax=Spirosoma profusum TaxID=2771354 RepID=A0A926Y3Q0_9BACT|nr:hypothetical protein [Spirosoma profusum]MBD2704342.1 hypothetical protein [Spirosoma profusum]